MSPSFGERLGRVFETTGRLCVGIDPHSWLLNEWGLPDTAEGARSFGLTVIDAISDNAGIVKPQVAFFERFGAAGFAALEEVICAARERGLLVIADAKRGDVGSTVDAYAAAWLSPGSPLESDAMTINPFQGVGSLTGALNLASGAGKGVFVLTATSNPEGAALQQARLADGGHTVSRTILDDIVSFNNRDSTGGDFANVGAVVGATINLNDFTLDEPVAVTSVVPILAPGFGHQGADVAGASKTYGWLTPGVIVAESRSILSAGPTGITASIAERAQKVMDSFA